VWLKVTTRQSLMERAPVDRGTVPSLSRKSMMRSQSYHRTAPREAYRAHTDRHRVYISDRLRRGRYLAAFRDTAPRPESLRHQQVWRTVR
jgi:hypothetical protein